MTQMHQHTAHSVCGNLSAERCIVELQRGRPIVLAGSSGDRSVSLVETLNSDTLAQIMAHGPCQLIISKARANVIGIATTERACCVSLGDEASLDMLRNCVGLTPSMHSAKNDSSFSERHKPLNVLPVHTLQEYADAGLQLALEAHVLPALIMSDCSISATSDALRVSVTDARSYSCNHRELLQLSHARLPLANAERVELCV